MKYTHPTCRLKCLDIDKSKYELTAKYLKAIGVPIWNGGKDTAMLWDKEFPYMIWDEEEITASRTSTNFNDGEIHVNTFEEFIAYFEGTQAMQTKVRLNGSYRAIINLDKTIKVGCETFTFEKMHELYKAMTDIESKLNKQ